MWPVVVNQCNDVALVVLLFMRHAKLLLWWHTAIAQDDAARHRFVLSHFA
jgi:hypothetical protein